MAGEDENKVEEVEETVDQDEETVDQDKEKDSDEISFTPKQQDFINKIVQDRLKRDRDARSKEAAEKEQKELEEAEAAKLKENQKWEELVAKHEARIKELEPLEERVKVLEGVVERNLDSVLDDLGENAKAAVDSLPGELGVLEKLEWILENKNLFEVKEEKKKKPPDTNAGKKSGKAIGTADDDSLRSRFGIGN